VSASHVQPFSWGTGWEAAELAPPEFGRQVRGLSWLSPWRGRRRRCCTGRPDAPSDSVGLYLSVWVWVGVDGHSLERWMAGRLRYEDWVYALEAGGRQE